MELAPRTGHDSGGFTLIEVMVVLVIIGVMIAVATISFAVLGKDRRVEDEAQRLAAVLTQAQEEADLQGRDVGLSVGPSAYEFFYYDPRKGLWVPPKDDFFARRELPEGLQFHLKLESRDVVLKPLLESDDELSEEEQKKRTPQIMLLSSGDISPFELQIERQDIDMRWHVVSQPDNTIAAEQMDAQP